MVQETCPRHSVFLWFVAQMQLYTLDKVVQWKTMPKIVVIYVLKRRNHTIIYSSRLPFVHDIWGILKESLLISRLLSSSQIFSTPLVHGYHRNGRLWLLWWYTMFGEKEWEESWTSLTHYYRCYNTILSCFFAYDSSLWLCIAKTSSLIPSFVVALCSSVSGLLWVLSEFCTALYYYNFLIFYENLILPKRNKTQDIHIMDLHVPKSLSQKIP